MGSLDEREAKAQFLLLIDKVSGTHLPGFAIWLDSKLAEYKVQGVIKADDDMTCEKQYPKWIARSLRQHLSFMFHGDESPLGSPSPASESLISVAKRKTSGLPEGSCSPKVQRLSGTAIRKEFSRPRVVGSSETEEVRDCVIKLEGSLDDNDGEQNESRLLVNSPTVAGSLKRSIEQTTLLNPVEESPFDPRTRDCSLIDQYSTESSQIAAAEIASGFSSGKQYSAASNRIGPVESPSVSTPARPYPVGAPTTAGQSSVSAKSPTSVAISGDTSSEGPSQFEEGVVTVSHPESSSGHDDARCGKKPEVVKDKTKKYPQWLRDFSAPSSERFRCTSCLWICQNKTDMTRHVRKHTGERPYACSHCDYRSKCKGTIKTHTLRHTGEKPYKCVYCAMAFTTSSGLLRHQRGAHRDKPQTGRQR